MYLTLVQSCRNCGVTGVYVSDGAPTNDTLEAFKRSAGGMWCLSTQVEWIEQGKLTFLER